MNENTHSNSESINNLMTESKNLSSAIENLQNMVNYSPEKNQRLLEILKTINPNFNEAQQTFKQTFKNPLPNVQDPEIQDLLKLPGTIQVPPQQPSNKKFEKIPI